MTGLTSSIPSSTGLAGATTWTFDARGRLTQEQSARNGSYTHTFGYDSTSNLTTFKGASKTYNSKNQLTVSGFSYDSAGNPTTYAGTTFTYDAKDRLTSDGTDSYTYYTDGLRSKRTSGGTSTYFVYVGDEPALELDGSGNVTAVNTFGPDGLISRYSGSASTFYAFDMRGGTVHRLNSSGSILTSHMQDAYGAQTSSGSTSDPYACLGAQLGNCADGEPPFGWAPHPSFFGCLHLLRCCTCSLVGAFQGRHLQPSE